MLMRLWDNPPKLSIFFWSAGIFSKWMKTASVNSLGLPLWETMGGKFFVPYLDRVPFKDFESFYRFILMAGGPWLHFISEFDE
jgi:hypothetical protein